MKSKLILCLLAGTLGMAANGVVWADDMSLPEKAVAAIFNHYLDTPKGKRMYRAEKNILGIAKSGCNVNLGAKKKAKVKFGDHGPSYLGFSVSLYATFTGSLCNSLVSKLLLINPKDQYLTFKVKKIEPLKGKEKKCGNTYQLAVSNIKGLSGSLENNPLGTFTFCDLLGEHGKEVLEYLD